MPTVCFMRFPEGRAKALTLSYDDGVKFDKRLAEILDAHGIKCTFNISAGLFENNPRLRLSVDDAKYLFEHSDHEVACHGFSHPYFTTLPPAAITAEVLHDRIGLETVFDRDVRGMAYPYGSCNENVINILKGCGIAYSRLVGSSKSFSIPTNWHRIMPTCHHKDPELPQLIEEFINCRAHEHPKLFYMWGHSYEFQFDDNWEIIESFAEKLGDRDDIWYATNIEIYDYVTAYERLIWRADMSVVTNPSTIPVWVYASTVNADEPKLYRIGAGETVKIK